MKQHETKLAAKVAARNRVHQLAIDTVPKMIAALQPFIGKKVLNQGCVLAQKVRDALPKDYCVGRGASADQWFYSVSAYAFRVNFQVQECAHGGRAGNESWYRGETCAHLGEITDGILTSATNTQTWRTDYSETEVYLAREEMNYAKAAMRSAEEKLCGFGEYDN